MSGSMQAQYDPWAWHSETEPEAASQETSAAHHDAPDAAHHEAAAAPQHEQPKATRAETQKAFDMVQLMNVFGMYVPGGSSEMTHETKGDIKQIDGGLAASRTTVDKHEYGERSGSDTTKTRSVSVGTGGASYSSDHDKTTKVGENAVTHGGGHTVGLGGDGVEATLHRKEGRETAAGGTETERGYGIKNNKASFDTKTTKTQHHEVEENGVKTIKDTSQSRNLGMNLSTDGVGFDAGASQTNLKGRTTTQTAGADIDLAGNASAKVGFGMTDTHGNSASVGLKAGIDLQVADPVQVGHRFVVAYRRSKSLGASGAAGHGPVGVGGGASESSFDDGQRSFDTEPEAKEFAEDLKEHGSERFAGMKDASTVDGAMSLAVGESRGSGNRREGNLSGAVSLDGGSLGRSGHSAQEHETDVRRVSETVFDVSYVEADDGGKDWSASGLGLGNNKGGNAAESHTVTMRFDVSTEAGKRSFEKYCQDHQRSDGGKLMSVVDAKKSDDHDDYNIKALGSASYKNNVAETKTVDDAGVHKQFTGGQSHLVDAKHKWLTGDKDQNQDFSLVANEDNGKVSGYRIEAHFGGEAGTETRRDMMKVFDKHHGENLDDAEVESSGSWTMSADLPEENVAAYEKHDRRFTGKSTDDKLRALTGAVSQGGEQTLQMMKDLGHGQLDWNIELKGDKNFPGREGRELLSARRQSYEAQLGQDVSAAPALAGELDKEVAGLRDRRAAVADRKRYTDLPEPMRQVELKQIDDDLAAFEALRHRAALEAVKNHPGEAAGDIAKRTASDGRSDEGLGAEEQELAKLRDRIAGLDSQILDYEQQRALSQLHIDDNMRIIGDTINPRYSHEVMREFEERRRDGQTAGSLHDNMYLALDELRMSFLQAMPTPATAIAIGQALAAQLEGQLRTVMMAAEDLRQAANDIDELESSDDDDDV